MLLIHPTNFVPLVLFVAICVSVLGFNLIASSSVDLLTTARAAGYERIQTYLAKYNSDANQNKYITQNASQFDQPSTRQILERFTDHKDFCVREAARLALVNNTNAFEPVSDSRSKNFKRSSFPIFHKSSNKFLLYPA